jgi:hypothetical protein
MNLIQTNRLWTAFVHSSSYWNRIEKDGTKLNYRVRKEEEEKYFESKFTYKNKKLNQSAEAKAPSFFQKTIVRSIQSNRFPLAKGSLTSL